MHARSRILTVPADGVDAAVDRLRTEQLDRFHAQPGYRGFLTLVDRAHNKLMAISLWDSEDDMLASADLARETREAMVVAGRAAEDTILERWEVLVDDRP